MNRLEFLKKGFGALGALTIVPLAVACNKDAVSTGNPNCLDTKTETEGPYPTKSPDTFVKSNIVSDRQGTPLTVKIIVKNGNNSCAVMKDAVVDVWHCDAAGTYSEYGTATAVHFLRGRQTTDANGVVTFTSIYPGWYSGRAPHIHVHIFNGSGKSLLVTQIAFPEDVSKVVFAQGVYASKGQADTTNSKDGIFSDGITDELPSITGTPAAGYVLTHTINVSA
jgi:protocatechuate 3,4-dioxygenase beta subunit